MSSNMQQFSDMKAELAELASEFAQFKATQPNLEHFAGKIGEHLVRFEADVSHNFIDKFAGNFFRATTSITERVVNLEERQVKLEEMLNKSAETYRAMLAEHRREVAELHRAHLAAVKKLIDENGEQLQNSKRRSPGCSRPCRVTTSSS
jgi:prefoldin subunit 5